MGDVGPVDLKAALRAQLGSQRGKVSRSAEGRRALEREANNPHDARLARGTSRGNTVQLNVEIPEELKQRLVNAVRTSGDRMVAIVSRAIVAELARMEKADA
ncbi:MAG: hypothetical protein WDN31_02705 [Hyphomicrobium sp.]